MNEIVAAVGIAFTAFVGAVLVSLNLIGQPDARQMAEWEHPPDIYVQDSAFDVVTPLEIVRAAKLWEIHGFHFGTFYRLEPGTWPDNKPIPGAILLAGQGRFPDKRIAETQWWMHPEARQMIAARVMIGPLPISRNPTLIIAHELGHALGFDHYAAAPFGFTKKGGPRFGLISYPKGHIMHPNAQHVGGSFAGLHPPSELGETSELKEEGVMMLKDARRPMKIDTCRRDLKMSEPDWVD